MFIIHHFVSYNTLFACTSGWIHNCTFWQWSWNTKHWFSHVMETSPHQCSHLTLRRSARPFNSAALKDSITSLPPFIIPSSRGGVHKTTWWSEECSALVVLLGSGRGGREGGGERERERVGGGWPFLHSQTTQRHHEFLFYSFLSPQQ